MNALQALNILAKTHPSTIGVDGLEHHILLVMLGCADKNMIVACGGYKAIAERVGKTTRTSNERVNHLIELGYIEIHQNKRWCVSGWTKTQFRVTSKLLETLSGEQWEDVQENDIAPVIITHHGIKVKSNKDVDMSFVKQVMDKLQRGQLLTLLKTYSEKKMSVQYAIEYAKATKRDVRSWYAYLMKCAEQYNDFGLLVREMNKQSAKKQNVVVADKLQVEDNKVVAPSVNVCNNQDTSDGLAKTSDVVELPAKSNKGMSAKNALNAVKEMLKMKKGV